MGLDDLTPGDSDGSEEPHYQVGLEYPVEYTGCFVTPVFEVGPAIPDEYLQRHSNYANAMTAWIEDEHPLMPPEQFKEFVQEQSKEVFAGESGLRSQAVIKGTVVHDEWRKDPEDVELGFRFLVTMYYSDTHYVDGGEEYRRVECLMHSDLKREIKQVREMFDGTAYVADKFTIIPYEAGEPPLSEKYEQY